MAYTDDSATARLAAVRAAISDALTAQSYTARGRGKVMASIRELRAMEKELMQEVKDSSSPGMCSVGRVVPPS